MGPAIFKHKKGETLYAVRCIPLGGYVKLEGEDEESESERSLNNLPHWKKAVVLFAGSFMNLLLGLVVSIILVIRTAFVIRTALVIRAVLVVIVIVIIGIELWYYAFLLLFAF